MGLMKVETLSVTEKEQCCSCGKEVGCYLIWLPYLCQFYIPLCRGCFWMLHDKMRKIYGEEEQIK